MGVCTLLQITCIDINRDTCHTKTMYVCTCIVIRSDTCMHVCNVWCEECMYVCMYMYIKGDNLKQNKFAVIQQLVDPQ